MELYETIYRRSAIRKFGPKPVPEDVVRRIIDAGMHAPSAEHRQPWEFIWIRDRKLRGTLAELKNESRKRMAKVLFPNLPEERLKELATIQKVAVETAPVLIAVCYHDFDNPIEIGERKISLSHASAWQCIQNMWLAATAEGLGFSPTFFADDVYEEVRKLLGLPQGVELAAIVRIGYKAQRKKRKPIKTTEEKLHYDRF